MGQILLSETTTHFQNFFILFNQRPCPAVGQGQQPANMQATLKIKNSFTGIPTHVHHLLLGLTCAFTSTILSPHGKLLKRPGACVEVNHVRLEHLAVGGNACSST